MATTKSARGIAAAAGLATAIALASPSTSDISNLFDSAKNSAVNAWNNATNPTGYAGNEKVILLNTGQRLYAEFRGTVFEFHPVMSVDNDGASSLVYTANKRNKNNPIKGDIEDRAEDLLSLMYGNVFLDGAPKEKWFYELGVPHEITLSPKPTLSVKPAKNYQVPVPLPQYNSITDIVKEQAQR